MKYTVMINHAEYSVGIYETYEEAEQGMIKCILDDEPHLVGKSDDEIIDYDEDGYYEPVRIPGLNTNFSFPWSVDLIKKYNDKCDWNFISKNQNIIWNINLLNELKENLDWSLIMENVNPHLIIFYIDKYIDPNELRELKNKNSIIRRRNEPKE